MKLSATSFPIKFNSINTKIMVALILTLLITPLLTYIYVQLQIRDQLIVGFTTDMQRHLDAQVDEIYLIYNDVLDDLQFLHDLPVLQDFVENPNDANRVELETTFAAYSSAHSIFDQVRIIDADGMEVIRVNLIDGEPIVVPQSELQDKAHRNYFIDAIQLAPDEVYISNFDLNQEEGELEIPYKPVVRIAKPLYFGQDSIQGILLVNVLTDDIFDIIESYSANNTYYVVNNLGDIMFTNAENASEIMYASDLNRDSTFESVMSLSLEEIQDSSFQIDKSRGIIYRAAAIPFTGTLKPQQWYIVIEEDLSLAAISIDNTLSSIVFIGILGLIFSIGLGILLTRSITWRLTALEWATIHLKDKQWGESLALVSKIQGDDEIGTLARVFADTLRTLQDTYDRQKLIVQERTRELEIAHDELRQIDEAKTQLVEHIAHDIANPLTAIMMVVHRLRRTPEQYEILADRLETQSQQILDLLNKIRDLRSLETLEYPLDQEVSLDEIVHNVIERVQPQISNMQIEITEDVEQVPQITGNRLLLERLFENIYVNALKYTFDGKIVIHLYHTREQIVLSVKDTGIGIPEQDLPLIGTRFFRASNTPEKVPGTGIGMGIVRKSVELHGGTVKIESQLNVGTTITVNIPVPQTGEDTN